MSKKGFTLLELMIVIVIIGILASLALPRFMGARAKAYKVEAIQALGELKTIAWAYNLERCTGTIGTNAVWPTNWAGFGYGVAPNPASGNWTIALTTTAANGSLVITASGVATKATAKLPDVVLTLAPAGTSTIY